ncbi:MAG: TonB-dependent receptor [candidate division KSB1 bacterium]|nr:TonB-dependent receptor [candidate division KSB1 bacterium]MDZ7341857.1 TonB-dependent receptor [candidate division KSB1 bacterium]
MKTRLFKIVVLSLILSSQGLASGSLSGKLIDKHSGQVLPGAYIILIDTKLWTITDKYGHYVINNIPPGNYDIRVRMLGYAPMVIQNVAIRADFHHTLNFELVSEPLKLRSEIVITADKPLIQKDVSASYTNWTSLDLNRRLRGDNFYQILTNHSSIINGHIRGGRHYDTSYLIDGLSIQEPMFREISALVPLSAIADMNVQAGGFNAEYGQAMAGTINLTTKEGREKVEGFAKIYTDNIGLNIRNDHLRRMELSLGGPLLVSFGGPTVDLNYHVSGTMNFDNMQISNPRSDFKQTADRSQNYHYTSKFAFTLWHQLKIVIQTVASQWQLHDRDQIASANSAARFAVDQCKSSHRLNTSIIHTLSPRSFYTLNLARDVVQKDFVNMLEAPVSSNDPSADSNHWHHRIHETIYFFKALYFHQFGSANFFKLGIQCNFYRLFMNQFLFNLPPDSIGLPQAWLADGTTDLLSVKPYSVALFAQNKIEYDKLLLSFGLRFDYFNPKFSYWPHSTNMSDSLPHSSAKQATTQLQISPRVALSFPLLFANDRLHLNYGWFFQTPPLYYYYMNSSIQLNRQFSVLGNPELRAEQTEAFEISYQQAISSRLVLGATYYVKKIENMVNTQLYYTESTHQANYARFENLDQARIKGLEISLEKRPSKGHYSGKVSYTYSKAVGSGSFPEQNYHSFLQNVTSTHGWKSYPLAWDQRHKFSGNFSYQTAKNMDIHLTMRVNSPLPLLNQSLQVIDRGNWRYHVDARIIKSYRFLGGELSPYIEVLNLLDDQELDRNFNPYAMISYDYWTSAFEGYQYDYGRRIRLGIMMQF